MYTRFYSMEQRLEESFQSEGRGACENMSGSFKGYRTDSWFLRGKNLSIMIGFPLKWNNISPFLNRRFWFSLEKTSPGVTVAHLKIVPALKDEGCCHVRPENGVSWHSTWPSAHCYCFLGLFCDEFNHSFLTEALSGLLTVSETVAPGWQVHKDVWIWDYENLGHMGGFPGGKVVQNHPANAEDPRDSGSIPGLGRFPGGGNGNPLQYSCLENCMDRGAW